MEEPLQEQLKDFELIGRFLDFDLTEEELKLFEERMENDKVLQKRFRLFQEMSQHIDETSSNTALEEVKANFKSTDQQAEPKVKIRPLHLRRMIGIAAAVALLLVFGLW